MSNVAAEPLREIVLRPKRGFEPIPFRELWQFRDLLLTLAQRDVKLRYRQTALGAAWVVIQPLLAALIFSFVFGRVAGLPSGQVNYFVFSYAGLLGWSVFNSTLTKASISLVGNANLVSKIYFPRLILPFSSSLGVLLDFGVSFVILLGLLAIYHVGLTAAILTLPLLLLAMWALAMGFGLFAASLMVPYRDVQYIVPVVTQLLLYASPVAMTAAVVAAKVPGWALAIYNANPLVGLMEAFRWACLGSPITAWGPVLYSAVFAVVVLVLGALSFQKMERRFADVI